MAIGISIVKIIFDNRVDGTALKNARGKGIGKELMERCI